MLVIHAFGTTNVGRIRELNEDSFLTGRTVFAVADGMGGHAAGEVASAAALGPLREIDGNSFDDPVSATDALSQAVSRANELVLERAAADPDLKGMGTTLTTVMVRGSRLHLAHVGDSRAYLLRGGMLEMLTEDHTLVNQLVKEGRLTEEQAAVHPHRSVITRAIGVEAGVAVDTMSEPLQLAPEDQVLLCSDGLTGPVSDALIAEILSTEADGDVACRRLIDAANAGGGPDNITCVLLRVEGDGEAAPARPVSKAGLGDDDATAELGDPAKLDARRLAELASGDPDVDDRPVEIRGLRRRRVMASIVGIALILAVVIGGGVLLLNRSYYVGLDGDGQVGIYRGVQGSVLGISLATLVEVQDLTIDDLPVRLHQGLEDGIPFPSAAEARQHVTSVLLPAVIDDAPTPAPTPTPTATDEKDLSSGLQVPAPGSPTPAAVTPGGPARPSPAPAPTPRTTPS